MPQANWPVAPERPIFFINMLTINLSPHNIKEIVFLMVWGGIVGALISAYLLKFKNNAIYSVQHYPKGQTSPSKIKTKTAVFPRKKELILGLSILVPFVLFYVFLLLYKQDFVGYDNSVLTFYSTRGNPHPMPIWASSGRFWPLGHQEFNIISQFSTTPFAYHLFSAIQLLIALTFTFLIMNKVGHIARALIILAIIIQPNVVTVFFGLIYPERNIIFWLPIFIVCIQAFRAKAPLWSFCGALISAQCIIYYKEPAFALVGGFAASYLLLDGLKQPQPWQWRTVSNSLKQGWLYTSIALMSGIYLLFYAVAVIPNTEKAYTTDKNIDFTMFATFIEYLKADIILPVFLICVLARAAYVLTYKKAVVPRVDPLWDCLAFGTVLYFLAYVGLKLFRPYYMAPIDYIALMYMGQLAFSWLKKRRYPVAIATLALVYTVIFSHSTHESAYQILREKKLTDSHIATVGYLQQQVQSETAGDQVKLFFPDFSGYRVMEWSVLLDYKGFNLFPKKFYNGNAFAPDSAALTMEIPEKKEKDRCVGYHPYKCYYTQQPKPDNLIVFLPGDTDRPNPELKAQFEETASVLFHYQPSFSRPEKLLLQLSRFHDLPDDWMSAYIFQLKGPELTANRPPT